LYNSYYIIKCEIITLNTTFNLCRLECIFFFLKNYNWHFLYLTFLLLYAVCLTSFYMVLVKNNVFKEYRQDIIYEIRRTHENIFASANWMQMFSSTCFFPEYVLHSCRASLARHFNVKFVYLMNKLIVKHIFRQTYFVV